MSAQRHDELIAQLREVVEQVRNHAHGTGEDFYCLNLVAYMGERMGAVIEHIDAIQPALAAVEGAPEG